MVAQPFSGRVSVEAQARELNEPAWARLAQIIDIKLLEKLALKLGGTRVYVPKNVCEDGEFAQLLGVNAARQINALFGGERIYVPRNWKSSIQKLHWKSQVPRLRAKHFSVARIARTLGCSERQVYKIIAKANGNCSPDP